MGYDEMQDRMPLRGLQLSDLGNEGIDLCVCCGLLL